MSLLRTGRRRPGGSGMDNSWPGFVDALSTMLLVIIFLLSIFMLAQFFLGQALSSKEDILDKLRAEIFDLQDSLSIQEQINNDLNIEFNRISSNLTEANISKEDLAARILELESDLADAQGQGNRVKRSSDEQVRIIRDLEKRYRESTATLAREKELTLAANRRVDLLNHQLTTLRKQLSVLNAALEASEKRDKDQRVSIENLSQRLNAALASKVQELSQFRSEFFGRLKKVLGNRSDIRIHGDRFVFQSEVLFTSGSAVLGPKGKNEMRKLASALREISATIPKNIDWVLRVDGHTDNLPIRTKQFPSNWDLSTARALSVVKYLISEGIPAKRFAATGFGQFHPLDKANTPEARKRNRRIEMRLTQR
ncbi:MotB-like protein Atu3746 [hydrothermal vent metagenome]|uniref:MotB-like protein Atu3746 n=1 Tax=hydrothermal vent metagenome TaxID=652676 RepID=A0A3B0R415_9ZZZZ